MLAIKSKAAWLFLDGRAGALLAAWAAGFSGFVFGAGAFFFFLPLTLRSFFFFSSVASEELSSDSSSSSCVSSSSSSTGMVSSDLSSFSCFTGTALKVFGADLAAVPLAAGVVSRGAFADVFAEDAVVAGAAGGRLLAGGFSGDRGRHSLSRSPSRAGVTEARALDHCLWALPFACSQDIPRW